jgi:hypothetical protein
MVIRSLSLTILSLVIWAGPSAASERDDLPEKNFTPIAWQDPESLPRLFRNHCTSDWWHGPYCADHCGAGYQFYYCSNISFGCCHVGLGYCDWHGALRCAPGL